MEIKGLEEFLKHNNYIEGEYSQEAFEDAKKARKFAYKHREHLVLWHVLEIHRILMVNLNPRIAGKWRDCDVWIGGRHCKFFTEELLSQPVRMIINRIRDKKLSEEELKKLHVDFEKIHPFEDGNGRVGRILYNISRINSGFPLHIIHEGMEQMEYYKWFR